MKKTMVSAAFAALLVAGFPDSAVAAVSVSGPAGFPELRIPDGTPPETAGDAVEKAARDAGALSARVVSVSTKGFDTVVRMEVSPVRFEGDARYVRFFSSLDGNPLEAGAFEAALRLARIAAKQAGDALSIKFEFPSESDGAMVGKIAAAKADWKESGGSVSYSPYGQRFSGKDVVTVSSHSHKGGDTTVSVTVAKGLPELRHDSKGGNYRSFSGSIDKTLPSGLLTLRLSQTEHKTGGALANLDLTGASTRFDAEFERPLNGNLSFVLSGSRVVSEQKLGAAGWRDKQTVDFVSGGIKGAYGVFSGQAKLYKGLGGEREIVGEALAGLFDPSFAALYADGRAAVPLGADWSLELAGAAQSGSPGTPSPVQFAGGGPERGRHYSTGSVSGPSGVSASASVVRRLSDGVSAYAGVDGAMIIPALGDSRTVKSGFVGLKGSDRDGFSWDLTVTKAINPSSEKDKGLGIMVYFSWSF